MDIIVCIKRVPQTAEAEVKTDSSGKDIEKDRLTFDINESDTYALEEAVLLKEKFGGSITVISLGYPDTEDTLRIALAKGADNAIRIKAEDFEEIDGYKTAQLLRAAIKELHFDVIFTGCIATDDAYSQVGTILAELLDIQHATLVTYIEISNNITHIHRELEGGLLEHLEISTPALFTIQTGLNVPRYASLIAIRRAARKEIKLIGKDEISKDELLLNTRIEGLFIPPVTKQVEILTGSPPEVSTKLVGIIKEKGLI